jgi:hypothetical protein
MTTRRELARLSPKLPGHAPHLPPTRETPAGKAQGSRRVADRSVGHASVVQVPVQQVAGRAHPMLLEKVAPGALAVARPEGLDLSFIPPPRSSQVRPATSCWKRASGARRAGTLP